jgi:drug/metabolite transporter (DMT)-like permease
MSAVLAVFAGFLFALSASLQQRATLVAKPDRDQKASRLTALLPVTAVLRMLVRSRVWLMGWVTNLLGFLTQAAALNRGSLTLVQPLLVTQLLFSLPLAAARTRSRPRALDWAAGLAVCAGVGLFLSERDVGHLNAEPDRHRVLFGALAAAVLVLLLLLAARRLSQGLHAVATSVAAGLCFAVSAVFIKLTTEDLLHRGVVATATDWVGYSLAASTLLGLLIEQEAFRSGSLPIAVAGMSITNPVASFAMGALAFHEPLPHSVSDLVTFSAAAALLACGVVGLAHSPMVREELDTAADNLEAPKKSAVNLPESVAPRPT